MHIFGKLNPLHPQTTLTNFKFPSRQHGSNEIDIRGRPTLQSTLLKHPRKATVVEPLLPVEFIDCEWCAEAFPSVAKAIEHKFRKHRYDSTNYFCKVCGKLFPIKITLNQHMENEHKTAIESKAQELYKCPLCNVEFQTESAITFHMNSTHIMEKRILMPTECPPPSKKIKYNGSSEYNSCYYCHLCGSEYVLKYSLRKHIEEAHTEAERNAIPTDGIIKCTTCDAIFYNKKAYEVHNIYHKPDDYYCISEEQRQQIVSRVDQDFDVRRVPINLDTFIPAVQMLKKEEPILRKVKILKKGSKRVLNVAATIDAVATGGNDSGDKESVAVD